MSRNTKTRVLFFAPIPPPYGGVAEISRGLYESRLQTDFDVRLLDFSKRTSDRIQTTTLEWGDLWWGFVFFWRLVRALTSVRPEIMYIASSYDQSYLRNVLFMGSAKLLGVKVVCHFHGYRSGWPFEHPGPILRWVLRLTSRSYDRIIYLSDSLKGPMEEILGDGKGISIPNFIDPDEFSPSRGLRAEPPHILFLGRVTERKGVFVLIEAAARLQKSGYRFVLDFVGLAETEEEEGRVRRAVIDAGLTDVTVFHGVRAGKEKADLLSGACMLVLPSWADIFPVVVLEAFASGLPVVAASIAALPEMVHDGVNGYLCEPHDVDSLASAMRALLDNPGLRDTMGRENRRLAQEVYSRDAVAERVSAVIDEM
jgi:glycosyltransferase involved in cell wall biosynthesis